MPTLDPHPSDVMELLRRRGPGTRIAVAGASTNPEKYGNKIVRNLKGKGYTVLPVNPKEDLVEGLSVAHSIGVGFLAVDCVRRGSWATCRRYEPCYMNRIPESACGMNWRIRNYLYCRCGQ